MGKLAAGFGRRNVTPAMGVALAGYGLRPDRTVQAVLDELFARAVVIDDGARKVALVSVDICLLSNTFVNFVRARIHRETGIAPDAILIAATHSHSTPTTQFIRQWGELNPAYINTVADRIGEAVIEAAKSLKPVAIGVGKNIVKNIAHNRVHKDRAIDETLSVLVARDGRDVKLAAAHYACHPVFMPMDSRFVSAEFPGRLVRDLERDHAGAQGMFFNGNLGDINPNGCWHGVDAAQDTGRTLATASRQIAEGIAGKTDSDVNFASVDCDLELNVEEARREALEFLTSGKIRDNHSYISNSTLLRDWAHEILGSIAAGLKTLRIQIQAIRIGDAAFVAIPGEPYTFVGDKIRQESPFPYTLVTSCANGSIGYICEPRDYEEGSYGAIMVPKILGNPQFMPNAWEHVCAAALAALKKL